MVYSKNIIIVNLACVWMRNKNGVNRDKNGFYSEGENTRACSLLGLPAGDVPSPVLFPPDSAAGVM